MNTRTRPPRLLYHFTCRHYVAEIDRLGHLLPVTSLETELVGRMPGLVWLTDLARPTAAQLGLRPHLDDDCDRVGFRYEVEACPSLVTWWPTWRARARDRWPLWSKLLEAAPGALVDHWWVAERPVPAVAVVELEEGQVHPLWRGCGSRWLG